jgi:hypothetical protein
MPAAKLRRETIKPVIVEVYEIVVFAQMQNNTSEQKHSNSPLSYLASYVIILITILATIVRERRKGG